MCVSAGRSASLSTRFTRTCGRRVKRRGGRQRRDRPCGDRRRRGGRRGPDWLGAALRATLGTVVAARCRVRTATVPHRTDQARKLTSIFGKRADIVGSAADRCVKGTSYGLGGQEA